jgi:phage gpG-like protein
MMRGSNGPAYVAAFRIAEQVRGVSRSTFVPVDKGKLRASISVEMRNEGGPVAYVGSNVEYAVYVHEGTRRMRGRPYLTQALEQVMARFKGK